MGKDSQNCYRNARKFSGLTMPQAAEMLAVSESSVREYETGLRAVPDDVVLRMAKVYRTPWLRVQHLEKNAVFCEIFGIEMPKADSRAVAILNLQKEVSDVVSVIPAIIEETLTQPTLSSRLVRECKEAMTALLMVVGTDSPGKVKTACAGTQTATRVFK